MAHARRPIFLGDRVDLTGGLRWDRFDLDYRDVNGSGAETAFEQVDEMVSWRGGLVVHPRPEGSVYVGLGTSMNPSTEGLSLSASTANVDPERSRSYEAGLKWDLLGGRLGTTAAVFRTEKTNARTPGLNPGDRWCLCAARWQEALEAGAAPRVVLASTHEATLQIVRLADLKRYALDLA